MITTNGALHIKRYLGGSVGAIAQSIALGVGTAAEAVGSTAMDFEVIRANVILTSYDFVNNKLIFKATIPENFIGTVYEAGLWSLAVDASAGDYGSQTIATFESDSETWVGGTFAATAARIGVEALQHTPALSTSTTSTMSDIVYDLSGYSSADYFNFAYNVGNANTASIKYRFLTSAGNYYEFNIASPTAGYKVTKLTKGSATVTGAPTWSNITEVDVITTSTAGGASAVSFDGIRLEDADTTNTEYVLVARELLATPFTKVDTMAQDVEFALAVTVS